MATLIKRRERWYARVLWYENTGKQKERQVPLRTKSKVTARERLSAVNKVESDIKTGLEFTFPWMNEDGQTKVSRYTIYDALQEWMGNRQSNGIRPSTIRRNRYSMDSIMSIIGSTRPLSSIDTKLIDTYR